MTGVARAAGEAPPSPGYATGPGQLIRWTLRRQWRWIALGASMGVLWMAGFAAAPVAVGWAIDDIIEGSGFSRMVLWAVAICLIIAVSAIAGAVRHICAAGLWVRTGLLTEGHLSRRVLDRRGGVDRSAGELLSLGVGDGDKIALIADLTNRGGGAIVMLFVTAVWLLATSVPLGLIVLIAVPVSAAALAPFLSRYDIRATAERRALARASAAAADGIHGLRTVKGLGGETVVRGWFRERSAAMRASAMSLVRLEASLFATIGFVPWLTLVPVFWFGGIQAIDGEISPGTFVTVVGLAQFLRVPVSTLGEAAQVVIAGLASSRRITTVTTEPLTLTTPAGLRSDGLGGPALQLRGVVVADVGPIEAEVALGETVGLVVADDGAAAALVAALARHRMLDRGSIVVGGHDLADIPHADLPRHLTVVDTERPWLLAGSLLDNLRLARPDLEPAEATEALLAAACDEIVARPDALDRVVGERGLRLSGGQRQRVAVAQALCARPSVLVVIEPTSALDAVTEATLVDRFFAADRPTTVIVTRAPEVLARCDRVLFIDGGTVAAVGTHDQLCRPGTAYAALVLGHP
ncbi:MAG: ABC transporter ATP-binding protein [Actinomycetota bacterium]